MRIKLFIFICILTIGLSQGLSEINGGWNVKVDGPGSSQGENMVQGGGADPSVTMGITATSSLYGPGTVSDQKTGSNNLVLSVGGYELDVGYEGQVSTSLTQSSIGSSALTAFIGATASGTSTGNESYDLLGKADINTEGYLIGIGLGEASAAGSSYFTAMRSGTPSEIWGGVAGESELRLDGRSVNAITNTGGSTNGLHTESRVTKTITGDEKSSSTSQIISYASATNNARANVSSSGTAQGGAWDPSFIGTKQRLADEDVATSVTGEIRGYVESNGVNDAAAVSAILQATGSKEVSLSGPDLLVSGGPASYASATQSSTARRTYAETWVNRSVWGSVVRTNKSQTVVEWGNLSNLGSGAHTYEPGSNAVSFGKILLNTDYLSQGNLRSSIGNMSLDTYAEATKNKTALAGTLIGPTGDGTVRSSDAVMLNEAGFTGGLDHFSFVDPARKPYPVAETRAILSRAYVKSLPNGGERLSQPFYASTIPNPIIAWSRTDGSYDQSY